jgi:hypothetical protein
MDVEIKRFAKQDGAETKIDTFVTKFDPWPNIYLVGVDASATP